MGGGGGYVHSYYSTEGVQQSMKKIAQLMSTSSLKKEELC